MFNPLTPTPTITEVTSTHDGYTCRALCLVDGYPAQIEITVDLQTPRYSSFALQVFNPLEMRWDTIVSATPERVGHMEVIADLERLNEIAMKLWVEAELIVTTAHRRQDEVDVDLAVMRETAIQRRLARLGEAAASKAAPSDPWDNTLSDGLENEEPYTGAMPEDQG